MKRHAVGGGYVVCREKQIFIDTMSSSRRGAMVKYLRGCNQLENITAESDDAVVEKIFTASSTGEMCIRLEIEFDYNWLSGYRVEVHVSGAQKD